MSDIERYEALQGENEDIDLALALLMESVNKAINSGAMPVGGACYATTKDSWGDTHHHFIQSVVWMRREEPVIITHRPRKEKP